MELKIAFAEKCPANWHTWQAGPGLFITQCRACGVITAEGGTPKCLLNRPNITYITPEKPVK